MKQSIAGDATKLTIMKILTTALTMVTAMLLSRFRTLQEYGTYSQLQLVTTLVTTIFMIGLPNSISFFLARDEKPEERRQFLSIYFSVVSVLGIIAGVVLILAEPMLIKYFNNEAIRDFKFYLFLYPWTKIILSGIENLLVVYKKMTKLIVFKVLYSCITLLIVTIAWLCNMSFEKYMLAFVITEIIFSLWVYVISNNLAGGLQIAVSKSGIMKILRFSVPLGLASIVGTLSIEIDKLLIGYLYTTEELAIYTNASKEMPLAIVSSSITAVLMPQLVRLLKKNENKRAINLWNNATLLSYIVMAFFAVALFVFAPDVISLLYSDKYLPGVPVFRVYSLVLLLRVTYFGMILNSIGKTKFIFTTSILSLVLNVILNFSFYFTFGFIGPAIATFVSIAIVAFLQLFYTSKCVGIKLKEMFEWKKLIYISVVNVIMGVVAYLIKDMIALDVMIHSVVESIILGMFWGISYLLVMKKYIVGLWNSLNCST